MLVVCNIHYVDEPLDEILHAELFASEDYFFLLLQLLEEVPGEVPGVLLVALHAELFASEDYFFLLLQLLEEVPGVLLVALHDVDLALGDVLRVFFFHVF